MRIAIREQLGFLVLISSLIGLAVVTIATWVTNHAFVLDIRASRLSLTASLKAGQLTSNLNLMQSSVRSVTTRVLIQAALLRFYSGNDTAANWVRSQSDLEQALDGGSKNGLLLQAAVFSRSDTGRTGADSILYNATSLNVRDTIRLPIDYPDGSPAFLGQYTPLGFPAWLFPNFTYVSVPMNSTYNQSRAIYEGETLDENSALLLGPYPLNVSFSLVSLTLPIINNTSAIDILGWMTVVLDARLIRDVVDSPEGLDETGSTLLIGPNNRTNHFHDGIMWNANDDHAPDNVDVRFVLPVNNSDTRHPAYRYNGSDPTRTFDYSKFPAVKQCLTINNSAINNAASMVSTRNEEGANVAVGCAMPNTDTVSWIVVVEQTHGEVWKPITRLRNILLACVFGTVGGMLILAFPVAHYSSRPIRRLRDATKGSVEASDFSPDSDDRSLHSSGNGIDGSVDRSVNEMARKEGFFSSVSRWKSAPKQSRAERKEEQRRRAFRIPSKVKDRKHFVQDELTDLTRTFNEMTDELMMQYEKLEERVRQRTFELEMSKKAAEAANESKTLFIANISHELKTPLNGIMGMCAVCMSEDDPTKLKRSLGIIYKSGDLLLNLLTDLLTFSKNQVGQQLSLDEKEFRMRDISSQLLAIFDKQAKEGKIDLRVLWQGVGENDPIDSTPKPEGNEHGPFGTGRIKDMVLWGDQHRILQVVINLVSNSLKFTPPGGSVSLTIRCLGDAERMSIGSRKTSQASRQASGRTSRNRQVSASEISVIPSVHHPPPRNIGTANEINALDKPSGYASYFSSDRDLAPPQGRDLMFEFEVQDTGPGVPAHLQDQIFEPFVQGDLGLSKKYGGTGLGLSICSQLAKLMKGSVGLTSEEGHGSTFTMHIPLRHLSSRADSTASTSFSSKRNSIEGRHSIDGNGNIIDARSINSTHSLPNPSSAAAAVTYESDVNPRLVGLRTPFFAANPPLESPGSQLTAVERVAAEASKRGDKVRVLVAEDNKTNQEVVLRMLKLEDIFDVTVAQDGQEALDMVKASIDAGQPYNLIFMDVQMPNLNGLESTRLIRETGYSAPIVALSAYSEESNIKECIESGMNDFISKPIRRPRLKQVLKTFCSPIPEEPAEGEASAGDTMTKDVQKTDSAKPTDSAPASGRRESKPPPLPRESPPHSPMS
ncbi:hypothetical protein K402DRAFT_402724 [Aulographum hederae CBS 113979]|uniref:histidine kinase n=1 Tax=Aulographum hederae CBS 113979 TaxID=1176131 RepID=A0A6G1H629_9PEZI|nr:hypothetical protein K402DRAFT_402724 [Aulographum hederae CBS 113979]